MATIGELLTAQFYAWEKRGRGWQVWNTPIELEPPFQPFLGYVVPAVDDGRKPTFLSSLFEKKKTQLALPEPNIEVTDILSFYEQQTPALFIGNSSLIEIQVKLPTKNSSKTEAVERFLQSLRLAKFPISFEIIGLAKNIILQFTCREEDISLLRANLRAYFPDAALWETNCFLPNCWYGSVAADPVVIDFGLSHEFIIPLQTNSNSVIDNFIGIITALDELKEEEIGLVQVLFHSVQYDWVESAIQATTGGRDSSIFADAPKMVDQLKQKISSPLFACVFRIGVKSGKPERAWELAKRLGISLTAVFADSKAAFGNANELIPLSNDDYYIYDHEDDILRRETHRSGMILNCAELGALVRLPSPSIKSEKFKSEKENTKSAPSIAVLQEADGNTNNSLVFLGENEHQENIQKVCLSNQQRSRHLHIIGSSGSGKSTLIANLIKQDLKNGHGLCLLDPHGDLVGEVIANIPEHRLSDVILFDPADAEYPIGFNVLQANSELEKTLLASDLVAAFRRMSTSWGDVMDTVLANAILAFIESSRGGSLFDLKRFLVEKDFRDVFLQSVSEMAVRYFWKEEFPKLLGRPENAILIRLDAFLRQKMLRNIVCQKESKLNLREIMDQQKVLLVKLSQGAIGMENSFLLGTMLVSKINQIALSRQETGERPYFWLYLDEFHNFVTPTIEMLLSGVRKYNVGLVLAHQEYNQLVSRSSEVASSIMANCYTRICFRLGDADAQKFSNGFSFFDNKHLQNLGVGEAIARVERAEYDFNLKTPLLPKVSEAIAEQRRGEVIRLTRENYATIRSEVEKQFSFYQYQLSLKANEAKIPIEKAKVEEVKVGDTKAVEVVKSKAELTPIPTQKEPIYQETIRQESKEQNYFQESDKLVDNRNSQHQYLQSVIKRIGEKYGFISTLEKQVLGGIGKIDVALENESCKIACEVALTNTIEYEIQNIQKCLVSGFDKVIVISNEAKHLTIIRKKAEELIASNQMAKVYFLEPENFHLFLEKLNTDFGERQSETKVKGYQVKVSFTEAEESEQKTKEQAITELFKEVEKRKK